VWHSLLLMFVEPNGPNYELVMKGRVVQPPQSAGTALLSNRHFVEFGGLPLGQSAYVVPLDVMICYFVAFIVFRCVFFNF